MPAQVDAAGDLVLLAEQDRSLWNRHLISLGFQHLERSAQGDELSEYHVQAAIAAMHAQADSYETTDWPHILELYDQLMLLDPSPVVALNRAVALAKVHDPAAALETLDTIAGHASMRHYYLLLATRAQFWAEFGDKDRAAQYYREALACPCPAPERRFLTRRLGECEGARAPGTARPPG